jgi:hypothetical protein
MLYEPHIASDFDGTKMSDDERNEDEPQVDDEPQADDKPQIVEAPPIEIREPPRPPAKVVHDVKYNDEAVTTYDWQGRPIDTFQTLVYKGKPEIVKQAGSLHTRALNEYETIAINPKNLRGLLATVHYGWFCKVSVLKENNIVINTNWEPVYITGDTPVTMTTKTVRIVSSVKSSHYKPGLCMVPLLETLVHMRQWFNGMTLHQIASHVFGQADPAFSIEASLMDFLFRRFEDEFKELCLVEYTPIHRLFQCDFNMTFNHNVEKENLSSTLRIVKHMKNVTVLPVSRLFSEKTYGNIPWTIGDSRKKEAIQKQAMLIAMPLAYMECSVSLNEMPFSIHYQDVTVFPNSHHGSVSSIGIVNIGKDQDVFMRGELFEDTSVREQLIIMLMYKKHLDKDLKPGTNYVDGLRYISFSEKERVVRPELINYIRDTLLTRV